MPSITPDHTAILDVAGGVDTHQDTHTAAVIDVVGRVLGSQQFPATAAGYDACKVCHPEADTPAGPAGPKAP